MYETYLQNEREWDEKFRNGASSTKRNDEIQSHNRLSLIKVMKALEKELEIKEIKKDSNEGGVDSMVREAYNAGLQLSLDKIREFISKLEKYETEK